MSRGGWRSAALLLAGLMGAALLSPGPSWAVHGATPGDFNGDGYRDAVLPAPGADVAGRAGAGAVVALYGSKSGLSAARRTTITQNSAGVPSSAEAGDGFGTATATADLNRDGYADLVVSAPYEDTAEGRNFGLVTVLWGSRGGLTTATRLPLPADTPSHADGARFGLDLAALSLGGGPKERVVVAGTDGTVSFIGPFSRTGTYGTRSVAQNTAGVPGVSERNDAFGGALAVADLNRDGLADIVVGTPYEGVAGKNRSGEVTVIPGRRSGALGAGSYSFSQFTAGVGGGNETDDFFGTTVSVGDVNNDGRPELFVGASGENNFTGAVWVFPGGASGPTAKGSRVFNAASVDLTQKNGTLLGGNGLHELI
ncbi:FG-GAP repeat protein [Streptomyces adustus]